MPPNVFEAIRQRPLNAVPLSCNIFFGAFSCWNLLQALPEQFASDLSRNRCLGFPPGSSLKTNGPRLIYNVEMGLAVRRSLHGSSEDLDESLAQCFSHQITTGSIPFPTPTFNERHVMIWAELLEAEHYYRQSEIEQQILHSSPNQGPD